MNHGIRRTVVTFAVVVAGLLGCTQMLAQSTCPGGSSAPTPLACINGQVLNAQFTNSTITINGQGSEGAWATAVAQPLTIRMNSTALASYPACGLSATVKTLWDGNLLYILINVSDPAGIAATSKGYFFLDYYNEKWKKYTNSLGAFSLTYSAATSPSHATYTNYGVIKDRVYQYAIYENSVNSYNYEVALNMSGEPRVNGTQFGMDFEVYGAAKTTAPTYSACQLAWADGLASGSGNGSSGGDLQGAPYVQPENGSQYGTVVYTGWDGSSSQALDSFGLKNNLSIASNLNEVTPSNTALGPVNPNLAKFTSESLEPFNSALATANIVYGEATAVPPTTDQPTIDAANTALANAMYGLRMAGPGGNTVQDQAPYPDPFDLPSVTTLPDPFTFLDGHKVQTVADWNARRAEIVSLAQYYEYGYLKPGPYTITATCATCTALPATATAYTYTVTVTDNTTGLSTSFSPKVYLPAKTCKLTTSTGANNGAAGGNYPVVLSVDGGATTESASYPAACYAAVSCGYTQVSADNNYHWTNSSGSGTGTPLPYFKLYPFSEVTATDGSTNDTGSLMSWGWGCSRALDGIAYLNANNAVLKGYFNLNNVGATGYSRDGKSVLALAMADPRIGVVNPGGSGSGGAAPYRYDGIGYFPGESMSQFGHKYSWITTAYQQYEENDEAMADHIWHNAWNSNQMFPRFLVQGSGMPGWFPMDENTTSNNSTDYTTPGLPMIGSDIYAVQAGAHGWADRLPFDHHEVIAALAPRAIIVDSANADYSDDFEGDGIGVEGALPVYQFLGVPQNIAYNECLATCGHGTTTNEPGNFIAFMNMYFYSLPLSATSTGVKMLTGSGNGGTSGGSPIYFDPQGSPTQTPWVTGSNGTNGWIPGATFQPSNIYNTYFGGLGAMMPWLSEVPHADHLTGLTTSAGTLSPAFSELTTSYILNLQNSVTSITVTPTAEISGATITVNGASVTSGSASAAIPLTVGVNNVAVEVTAPDGASLGYDVVVSVVQPPTVSLTATAAVSGSHAGGYTMTITVKNTGTGPASNVVLSAASLGTTNGTGLPQTWGTIAAGGTGTFTVSVPGSAGADGAGVAEKFSGTYTGGSYSASIRSVTLP